MLPLGAAAEEPVLEISVSELDALLSELLTTYNQLAELVRESAAIRGRELAMLTTEANAKIKAARSPIDKGLLLNAFMRKLLAKLREAMKAKRGGTAAKIIQVVSKVEARAIKIIDYVKEKTGDGRKEIALDSKEARTMFLAGGDYVSRKECIRSMKRVEKLLPVLECGHRPNDPWQTMRLTGLVKDLIDCDLWQRSGLTA